MKCLECGSQQAGDVGECARCGAPVSGPRAEPAVIVTGRHRAELRMDEHGIRVENTWTDGVKWRVIRWDEVRWLRDGPRVSPRTRWVLEIVRKDGSVVLARASRSRTPSADPQTLQAIRRAARRHAIPAVLTGRPVERFQAVDRMPEAGLYPDPGGEPGLREWDGTRWSPVLHTDPAVAFSDGTGELATTWSPLPKQAQQQHAERAASVLANRRFNVGALVVLTLILAAGLLAGLAVACYWLASPGAGVSDGAQAAIWATNLFLAACPVWLVSGIRRARRDVRRHQRIAEVATEAASLASAHDVASLPGTTWIVSGRHTELRLDDHEITVRTRRQTRWIAWDDVRWFRDGKHFHLSRQLRNDGWALAIVLKDGSVVIPDASKTTQGASQETIAAVKLAARQHDIPAVLTGRPVSDQPSPADKPGLYPDPGGEPGLREWNGTEWLTALLVDPATGGPLGEHDRASISSPLAKDEQQRQWDAAIAAVEPWYKVVHNVLGLALGLGFSGAALPAILVVQRAVKHGWELTPSPVATVLLYAATCVWTCGWAALSLLPVRNRRAAGKVARAARTASAQAAAEATTTA